MIFFIGLGSMVWDRRFTSICFDRSGCLLQFMITDSRIFEITRSGLIIFGIEFCIVICEFLIIVDRLFLFLN
ncbi:hypothetical protein Hanom_Chr03g00269981 [Helianthus anomalus]